MDLQLDLHTESTRIDPRGPRFGAWITSFVLVVVLLLSSSPAAAGVLLTAQAVVFALGSRGRSPYGPLFKKYVRPRLAPPTELEDEAPPRFAQAVGLAFAVAGVLSLVVGATLAGQIFTGFALVAALLNASIGLCLGCEVYLFYKRVTNPKGAPA
ncbi:MAG: DUF4395 domain-containing protein [Actinomycetota bacterium]|nr:DUF4395 domain-containing protein [Actinomycetota bacterium]